jgi:hypothetical protein
VAALRGFFWLLRPRASRELEGVRPFHIHPLTHPVRRIPRTVSSSTRLERRLLNRSQKPRLPVTFSVLEGGAGSGIIRCELAGTHRLIR